MASNQTVQVAFSHVLDQFLIAESNLPAGTNWSMTLGPTTEWSIQPWLEFNVTNGTYNYSIPSVDGYAATGLTHSESDTVGFRLASTATYSGQLQIYARWVNATLGFTPKASSTGNGGWLGLSEVEWIGIVALAAVVAAATFLVICRRYPPTKAGLTVKPMSPDEASTTQPDGR